MFLTGVGQRVVVRDLSAPVANTAVTQLALIVTQAAIGADAAWVNQVSHSSLIREFGAKVSATGVVQQTLVITERPPGLENVQINNTAQTILVAEPGAPALATQVSQNSLILEPPAPARVQQVNSSTLLVSEGPILTGITTGVIQTVISQDLYHGELYAASTVQLAAIITEVKSRDPDRLKVLTTSNSYLKAYDHPTTFAERHRIRILTRGIACNTKFKAPTAVAAVHTARTLTSMAAVEQPYTDPKDLAAKIQVTNLERAVATNTFYPERVISSAVTQTAAKMIAVEIEQLPPQDIQSDSRLHSIYDAAASSADFDDLTTIRSQTHVPTVRSEVAYVIAAIDPSGMRTTKTARQVYSAVATSTEYLERIQSDTHVHVLDILSAHNRDYDQTVQSSTVARTGYAEVATNHEYIIPTDPIFKSQIRLNRLKNETMVSTTKVDPIEVRSKAQIRAVKVEHVVETPYRLPVLVRSSATASFIDQSIASAAEMKDPAGIKPGRQLYQLQFSSTYTVDRYDVWPTSTIMLYQSTINLAMPTEMRDPSLIDIGNIVNQLGISVVVPAIYSDPAATRPNRRVSSARVTRI